MKTLRKLMMIQVNSELFICGILIMICLYFMGMVVFSPAPVSLKLFVCTILVGVTFMAIDKIFIELMYRITPFGWVVRQVQIMLVRLKVIAIVSGYDGYKFLTHRIVFPGWDRIEVSSSKTKMALEMFEDSSIDSPSVVEEYYPGHKMDLFNKCD